MADRRRAIAWIIIGVITTGYAFFVSRTVSVDFGFDAMIHVEQALRYEKNWAFFSAEHYDQSPPLRYVPYTILLEVLDPGDYEAAFRLATLYAAIMTFAGGGIAAYELGRRWVVDPSNACGIFTCVMFFATALIWPGNRFYAGKWQYTTTFPLIIVAILTAVFALRSRDRSSNKCAFITGVVLGVLGLQQLTNAGVVSIAIGITFLLHRRFRQLVVTGVTGAAFASLLFVGQSEAENRALNAVWIKFVPESRPLAADLSPLLTPGVLTILFSIVVLVFVTLLLPERTRVTDMMDAVMGVMMVMWGVSRFTTAQEYLTVTVLHPMMFFVLTAIVIRTTRVLTENGLDHVGQVYDDLPSVRN
jgi:hypothetical protein